MLKKISKDEEFSVNSNPIEIEENKTYQATVNIVGIKGKPKSAYFTVIIWDSSKNEIIRYKNWIDDFSGNPKEYSIIFKSPKNSHLAFIGIRINQMTHTRSDVEVKYPDISFLTLDQIKETEEQYDEVTKNYLKSKTLSENEENILEKNIVWIFATARSGTTWLGTQLLNYKSTVPWHEPYIGHHFAVLDGHKNRPDYFFSNKYRKVLLPSLRKLMLNRAYLHAGTIKKKIVIKEPNGVSGSEVILESMPESKLIYLIRDGRDVVDSLVDAHKKNSWNKLLEPFKTKEELLSKIEQYSIGWVNTQNLMEKVYQNHKEKLRLMVFYEKLRENTHEEMKKIYDFLKIQIPSSDLDKIIKKYDFDKISESKKGSGKFTRSASPGKWRENFTDEEKTLLHSIMGKTLKKFGYEV